jgi:hypothetical protein
VLTKVLLARLIAVLIAGTLASAPFSCCCAQTQSQELESLSHTHSMAAMHGMSHDMAVHQLPDGDHLCPHRLTASLKSGPSMDLPSVASVGKPVVYLAVSAADFIDHPAAATPIPRIKPPPVRPATLVSQHVLLLI